MSKRLAPIHHAVLVLALVVGGGACDEAPAPPRDADVGSDRSLLGDAAIEASAPDAQPPDLPPDRSAPDAAAPDAETPDAGPPDAAQFDALDVVVDAAPDAPAPDAAPDVTAPDASVDAAPMDAPTPDVTPMDVAADAMAAAPRIYVFSPMSAVAGDADFALTIRGAGFAPGATVTWAGAARAVTFINASTLRINVAAADVAAAATPAVVVSNPAPGDGRATASFRVFAPLAARTWLAGSTFRTGAGWFTDTSQQRVWLADIDGDRIEDVVGVDAEGYVWSSRGTGVAFAPSARLPSQTVFRNVAEWFIPTSQPRVWVTDVTGDGRADIVGVDNTGGVWVSESNGASFNASRLTATTTFTNAAGYFTTLDRPHIFLADMNADGKTDIVGVHPTTGRVGVALATGMGAAASFQADVPFLATSLFNNPAEWFLASRAQRLFLGDVTGDRRADLVGLATNGDVYVAENTGTAMNAPRRVGGSVFTDANGVFAAPAQSRVSLADMNGDGRLDLVGVLGPTVGGAPAAGDGDIWTLEATGSGSTASFSPHVLLNESAFRARDGWFASASRSSVWFTDVTGDGRADVVGVDPRGGVWVARSVFDASSAGVTPATRHDFLLPAVKTGDSGFAASHFSTSLPPRVFAADVTGDGARDLVAISGVTATDGDIHWQMAAPSLVESITPITRQMLAAGGPQRVEVALTRRIDAASFDAAALALSLDGAPIVPAAVAASARAATFTVTLPMTLRADVQLDLALSPRATDAWGNGVDGDGDGRAGGGSSRTVRWSPTLVAGASRVSLMPPDVEGIPRSAGFEYCPNVSAPGTLSTLPNPTEARVLVIAGGGTCAATAECAGGQSCVAGQCQGADGVDANRALVLVSLDLIGVNPGRLAELLARRYGIPKESVILSATHNHAAFRSIRLFDAPYFDERDPAAKQYETWLEDRVAEGVGEALADMTPVEVASATAPTTGVNLNRRFNAPPSAEIRTVTAVALRSPGSPPRTRALLVSYAMHPVFVGGGGGINADFPGYMRQELEGTRCASGDTGCAVLFLQAGGGDINPADNGADSYAAAQLAGRELARTVSAMPLTFRASDRAQVLVQRRVTHFDGTSACNNCGRARVEAPVRWGARATAVSIGAPGAPALLRFGTLPGEAFSGLQEALTAGLTPAPLLLGYANGYLGYLPTRGIIGDGAVAFTRYGVVTCDGPTFFASSADTPTIGDTMVAGLRAALMNELR